MTKIQNTELDGHRSALDTEISERWTHTQISALSLLSTAPLPSVRGSPTEPAWAPTAAPRPGLELLIFN